MMGRTLALALSVMVAAAGTAAAQDRTTILLHGLKSSPSTWNDTASRLQSDLQVVAHRPEMDWAATFETQAAQASAQMGGVPVNTVLVGHSNGGVIAREWSRSRPFGAIVTIGTPHQGAPLAHNIAAAMGYQYHVWAAIEDVWYEFGAQCCNWNWVWDMVWQWPRTLQLDLEWLISQLPATIGFNHVLPVISQMSPQSNYMFSLNSGSNQAREAGAIGHRVSVVGYSPNFYDGGPFRAALPDYGDLAHYIIVSAEYFLRYWGEYVYWNAEDYTDYTLADKLLDAAGMVSSIEPAWCVMVGDPFGSEDCYVNDTVVPGWGQLWPGSELVFANGFLPPHIKQTTDGYEILWTALINNLGIPPRSGSGPPSGASDTLASGQSLWADDYLESQNGNYRLLYQSDGNLVVYRTDWTVVWASGSLSSPGQTAMQGDGNLVIYDSGGGVMFATNTNGHDGAYLRLLNDGSLVLYGPGGNPLWWTAGD